MATLSTPFPIANASATYSSDVFYDLLSDLVAPGVVSAGDFAVSQRAAGANLSVDVANGSAFVQFNSPAAGIRRVKLTAGPDNSGVPGAPGANWLATFTTPSATNPRIDRVVLTVQDNNFDGSGQYRAKLQVVAGTATAGATLVNLNGAPAVPVNSLLLANVLVTVSATTIANSQIDTTISTTRSRTTVGAGNANSQSTPAGSVVSFAGAAAPSGWLLCDGTAVSRATYATLFGVTGTLYGAGDGSTTFNLPDFRGRMAVGLGTHTDVASIGNSDGVAVGSRRPKHKHTVAQPTVGITDPGHAHGVGGYNTSPSSGSNGLSSGDRAGTTVTGSNTTGISATASGGTVGPQTGSEPIDSAAYLVVNYIVKT